jgi:hypothetical protein
MSPQIVVRRQQPPCQTVPVRACAAKPRARQERAEPADRQRYLRRRMPERDGLFLRILKKLLARRIFEIVANVRQCEVFAWHALGASLKADHVKSGLGEFTGHDAAGPTDADHHRINFLQNGCHARLPFTRNPRSNAAACRRSCPDICECRCDRSPASPDIRPFSTRPCRGFHHRSDRRRSLPW